MKKASRRTFLKLLAAVAGGLTLGVKQAESAAVIAKPEGITLEAIRRAVAKMRENNGIEGFVMIHASGGKPCGDIAALMTENPLPGSIVSRNQFRKLDGTRFSQVGSDPYCGSCGGLFHPTRAGIVTGREAQLVRASIRGQS